MDFDTEFANLIAFEEISDYNIVNEQPQIKKKSNKNSKKSTKTKDEIGTLEQINAETSQKTENIIENWSQYNLPECLLKAIAEVGYEKPTEIQEKTLKVAIFGRRDIVGAAETGSGKTLAFGLPILYGILKQKEKQRRSDDDLYALILTPTRELAVQIKNNLKSIAKYCGIRIAAIFGGLTIVKQERILSKRPEIVIATPGRLWELLRAQNEHLMKINKLRFLVIDETDRMLEKNHFLELNDILEMLNEDECCEQRQNFVFSATLTMVHDLPQYLALKKKFFRKKITKMTTEQKLKKIVQMLRMTNVKVVDVTLDKKGISSSLKEAKITCSINEKDMYVYYFLILFPGRTLIFCNSIGCVKRLTTLLTILNCSALPLHASMQQKQRLKNLEKFRDNDNGILIATDVAARGLDIPNIDHVIHYQTPRTSETYVHRSGRTARLSKKGLTVILIEPNEIRRFHNICHNLEKTDDVASFPIDRNMFEMIKERIKIAQQLDKMELKLKKFNIEKTWLQKASEEMDMIVDDKELLKTDLDNSEIKSLKKTIHVLRKQLTDALRKPIVPKLFSINYPTAFGNNYFEWQNMHVNDGGQSSKRMAVDLVPQSTKSKKIRK